MIARTERDAAPVRQPAELGDARPARAEPEVRGHGPQRDADVREAAAAALVRERELRRRAARGERRGAAGARGEREARRDVAQAAAPVRADGAALVGRLHDEDLAARGVRVLVRARGPQQRPAVVAARLRAAEERAPQGPERAARVRGEELGVLLVEEGQRLAVAEAEALGRARRRRHEREPRAVEGPRPRALGAQHGLARDAAAGEAHGLGGEAELAPRHEQHLLAVGDGRAVALRPVDGRQREGRPAAGRGAVDEGQAQALRRRVGRVDALG